MSRMRTFTAFTVLAAFMCLGIGTASADNAATASTSSNASVVSDYGTGNIGGHVDGNASFSQQTGVGGGASNANSTAGVKDNSGTVGAVQGNSNRLAAELYY